MSHKPDSKSRSSDVPICGHGAFATFAAFAPRFRGVLNFQQTPDLRRSPEISGDLRFGGSSSAIFRSPNLASVVFPKIGEVGGAPTIKDSAILRSPKLDCRNFLRYKKGGQI